MFINLTSCFAISIVTSLVDTANYANFFGFILNIFSGDVSIRRLCSINKFIFFSLFLFDAGHHTTAGYRLVDLHKSWFIVHLHQSYGLSRIINANANVKIFL